MTHEDQDDRKVIAVGIRRVGNEVVVEVQLSDYGCVELFREPLSDNFSHWHSLRKWL